MRDFSGAGLPHSQPIHRMMVYDPDAHRPFTLWLETLPSNDTARLLIWPRSEQVQVELYWNRELHSEASGALPRARLLKRGDINFTAWCCGTPWPEHSSDMTMKSSLGSRTQYP